MDTDLIKKEWKRIEEDENYENEDVRKMAFEELRGMVPREMYDYDSKNVALAQFVRWKLGLSYTREDDD